MSKRKVITVLLLLVFVFSFSLAVEAGERTRDNTLVYGGGLWVPPSNWNPIHWDAITGTDGLVYETLFHYDPLNDEFIPWLAEDGYWLEEEDTYFLELREDLHWQDGEDLDAEDVKFTFTLAREYDLPYSPIWDWLDEIEIHNDTELSFVFDEAPYHEWQEMLYDHLIFPEHIWSEIPGDELLEVANEEPVGSGAYKYYDAQDDRMIWERNDDWWGIEHFGEPTPRYLENVVVYENNIALGMLLQGELDLSNYFLPGIPSLKESPDYDLTTYYEDEPYMLPENTAMLFMNTERPGLDDPEFRRALAFAINPEIIVERVFEGMVEVADPTGLFGDGWMELHSEEVADEYGFHYDPETAEEMLDEAGYVDTTGDGWRNTPDGDDLEFTIIVPGGWTDWMESIDVIAEQFNEIGIDAEPDYPDISIYEDQMFSGDFDMLINNFGSGLSSTPYSYWDWVAYDQIDAETVTDGNFGRYDNPELFEKIDQFSQTPIGDEEAEDIAADIQQILLEDMPSIPMWYNGMWAQSTNIHWTNWPTEDNPVGLPSSWEGMWTMGGLDMLIELEQIE